MVDIGYTEQDGILRVDPILRSYFIKGHSANGNTQTRKSKKTPVSIKDNIAMAVTDIHWHGGKPTRLDKNECRFFSYLSFFRMTGYPNDDPLEDGDVNWAGLIAWTAQEQYYDEFIVPTVAADTYATGGALHHTVHQVGNRAYFPAFLVCAPELSVFCAGSSNNGELRAAYMFKYYAVELTRELFAKIYGYQDPTFPRPKKIFSEVDP